MLQMKLQMKEATYTFGMTTEWQLTGNSKNTVYVYMRI